MNKRKVLRNSGLVGVLGASVIGLSGCAPQGHFGEPVIYRDNNKNVIGKGYLEGNFVNGKPEGVLKKVAYADLSYGMVELTFLGNYSNGMGEGIRTIDDNFGSHLEGYIHEKKGSLRGVLKAGKTEYRGTWDIGKEPGKVEGSGEIIYFDGRVYSGDWEDPNSYDFDFRTFPNGQGIMKYSDGRIEEGTWNLGAFVKQ